MSQDPDAPQQRGYLVHGFKELADCIPTGNDEYAWVLTTNYGGPLRPASVYLATQYGETLPEKPISNNEKIKQIWRIPNLPYQLWAATDTSLFLIDVPHDKAPLVDQARFISIFRAETDETISRLAPVPNQRSAWLITQRKAGDSIKYSLHYVDADKSQPVTRISLPQGIEIRAIFASPQGNSAWAVWQKSPGFTAQGGAMFLENNGGTVSARAPIAGEEYGLEEVVPIKDGTLAWNLYRDYLLPSYFTGNNPSLMSKEGGIWSVSARLFSGQIISYAVGENIGDELPMWVWIKDNPGVYLVEATGEGPRVNKQFIGDVTPQSIVPSRDGKAAWVLDKAGINVYRLGTDGSARKFELKLRDEMQAASIRSSPNGQKAWVAAGQLQTKRETDAQQTLRLFFLDSTSEQNPKEIPLSVRLSIILPAPDNQHAFSVDSTIPLQEGREIRELKYYLLNNDKLENGGASLLTVNGTISTPWAKSLSPLWVYDGNKGCWMVRWKQGAIASASISFNKAAGLTYKKDDQESHQTLSPGTPIRSATVELSLEGQRPANSYEGSVQLSFFDRKSGNEVYKTPAVKLSDQNPLQLDWSPSLNHPYEIELTFRDQYGTNSVIRWSNIEFQTPIWDRPWVRTVVVFLIICFLSVLTFALKPINLGLRRWLPVLVFLLGGASTVLEWIGIQGIDGSLFRQVVAGSGVLLVLAALVSYRVFRALAQVQPFHLVTPYLLSLPSLRRKVFAPYAKQLREQMRLARERANSEVYTAIPATIQSDTKSKERVKNPAEAIANALSSANNDRKRHILIEAPGGTGKTALLREVIDQSLTRFLENPQLPLPVLCKGKDTLEEMAQTALGKYAISPGIVASQINEGRFFLVIDGPQESKVSPDQIRDWVNSEKGEHTVLLIASRPKDEIREAVQMADHWSLVNPERLTDETLDIFQDTYITRSKSEPPPQKLTEQVKAVCRGTDGSYLPILVRLALLVGSQQPHSIAQLYQETFRSLLPRTQSGNDDLLDQASKLCVDTYWTDGQRAIVYDRAPAQRSRLMEQLREAGVLVPSDGIPGWKGEPREVRFFHDSMQSYLTARGLLNGETPWKEALIKAAGDPKFRESQHADSPEHGSELFGMCLQVFGPADELKRGLRSDLLEWANAHDKDLTRNDVEQSLPASVLTELNTRVAPTAGTRKVLKEAVELLTTSSDSRAVQQLGVLYARIAEKVWAHKR